LDDITRHRLSPIKPIHFPEIIIGHKINKSPKNHNSNNNSKIITGNTNKNTRPVSKKPSPSIVIFEKYDTPVKQNRNILKLIIV